MHMCEQADGRISRNVYDCNSFLSSRQIGIVSSCVSFTCIKPLQLQLHAAASTLSVLHNCVHICSVYTSTGLAHP